MKTDLRPLALCCALFSCIYTCFAQIPPAKIWDKALGGTEDDYARVTIPAGDGNYLVGGNSLSNVSFDKSQPSRNPDPVNLYDDFWLMKVTPSGTKIWDKTFGGYYGEYINAICPAPGGGFLLAGTSYSNISGEKTQASKGSEDFWIVKIDANGNKLWDKTIGGNKSDVLQAAFVTADGGYLLCGTSSSDKTGDKSENNIGNRDFWVVKTDADGNKLWDKTYGDWADNILYTALPTANGGYLLAGYSYTATNTNATYGGYDYWLLQVDANGTAQWNKTYGSANDDKLNAIAETADGGYLLAGESAAGVSGVKTSAGSGLQDFWIVKVNSNGTKEWDKTFGGSHDDIPYKIEKTTDGSYLIGGSSRSPVSGDKTEINRSFWEDYWLIKIDASGTLAWDKTIGGDNDDVLRDIDVLADGGLLLTGSSASNVSGERDTDYKGWDDVWLVKLQAAPGASSVNTPGTTLCRGGSVNVAFKANGPLAVGNIYTAQLSDWTGKFSSITSSATLASTALTGNITLPVPADIPASRYRVRILSSTPGATVATNGPFLNIIAGAAATTGEAKIFCTPTAVELGAPAVSGNTYSWTSTPAGFTSAVANPTVTPTVTTTYTLTETVQATGCSRTNSVVITVAGAASKPVITSSGATEICSGSTVTLTSSATSGNQWYKDGAPINSATATTYVANAGGVYTVSSTTGGCSSEVSDGFTLTVKPKPSVPAVTVTGPLTFCQGESVLLTAADRDGYQWYKSGTAIPNATEKTYTATESGYYSVASVSNGCSSFPSISSFIEVTVKFRPVKPTVTANGSATFCEGGSVVLTSTASSGNQWYKDGNKLADETNWNMTASTSGVYSVIATSANGCSSLSSDNFTVTASAAPAAPVITASGATSFCEGNNVVLTSSATTGNQWYKDNVQVGTDASLTASASGVYTVKAAQGGCTSALSAGITIASKPVPAVPVITAGGATAFCAGNNVVLTSSASSGNQWYKDQVQIATTSAYTATQTGNYTVTASADGCTSAESAIISVTSHAIPATPVISTGGPTDFCTGGSVVLSSSAAAGNQWYHNGLLVSTATAATYTATQEGQYSVMVTQNGCSSGSSASTAVTVKTVPPMPSITQSGDKLLSSAQGGNQWLVNSAVINGATESTYQPPATSDYSVRVTQNGCSATSLSFHFIMPERPSTEHVSVYPNPVVKELTIRNNGGHTLRWKLFDISGKLLLEGKTTNTLETIDMGRLSGGIYQLQLTDVQDVRTWVVAVVKV